MSTRDGKTLKSDREQCHSARDEFFKCLDQQYEAGLDEDKATRRCSVEKRAFDKSCPTSWMLMLTQFVRQLAKQNRNVAKSNKILNDSVPKENSIDNAYFNKQVFKNVPSKKNVFPPRTILPNGSAYTDILRLAPKGDEKLEAFVTHLFECHKGSLLVLLSGLRECRWFDKGRTLLEKILKGEIISDTNQRVDGTAILEGARLLATAHAHEQGTEDDANLAKRMMDQFKKYNTPPIVKTTTEILLFSLYDHEAFLKAINDLVAGDKPAILLHKQETFTLLGCYLLKRNEIDLFVKLLNYPDDPCTTSNANCAFNFFNSPEIVYWLLKTLNKTEPVNKKKLAEWYFRALLNHASHIEYHDFLNLVIPVLKSIGAKAELTQVLEDGRLSAEKDFQINMKEDPLDLQQLQNEMNDMMEKLSSRGGSLSKEELHRNVLAVEKWKRRSVKGKAVVVDTLNVTAMFSAFKFMKRIVSDFPNVLLVTRRNHVKKLDVFKLPERVHKLISEKLSEDDLFVIAAAIQYGEDCVAVSNDRFRTHKTKFTPKGAELFNQWTQQRVARYDPETANIWVPHVQYQKIQRLSQTALFLPVVVDTAFLPYYTQWIVKLP